VAAERRSLAGPFAQPVQPGGTISSVPLPSTSFAPAPYAPRPVFPTAFGYPYGGVYVENPISGYFNGVANLTSAYGQYQQDYQRGRLLNQEVERSKLATRRAWVEYQMWEQSLQPKAEDVRLQKLELELRRAMNNPPVAEIISGDSLNTLLRSARDLQSRGAYGPTIPVDPETLQQLNLSSTPGVNVALFKDGGKLRWPFALRDTPFDSDREKTQELVYRAIKETQADELSPSTLRELKGKVVSMENTVERMARDMSLQESIEARRYIDELSKAVKSLEHREATASLNKRTVPQGRTVAEVVQYMTRNGLNFVAALPGSEGAYRAMHHYLVSYNYGTMQASRR